MSAELLISKGTNSPETVRILTSLSSDILVLGQTGIVKQDVLKIPKIGTLNAHPGILPEYRGIDCAKWAIYQDEFCKIGSSVHWVDKNIDTGNIIQRRAYGFSGNETIDLLEENLESLCALQMTEVIAGLIKGESLPGEPQYREAGSQYHKMPRKFEALVRKKLQRLCVETHNVQEGV